MGEELEKIFDALGHRVRRRVVEELGKRGSATYSELMKAAGVEDSGTFAFHLRKLLDLGLVRKNERGEYELTDLGMRAYSMIKFMQGELAAYPQPSTTPEIRTEVREPVVIADAVRFVLTRGLAESLRRSGHKIRIQRVTKVVVEPMPRELLEKVLETIEDCNVIEAPGELMDVVMARSRNVTMFRDLGKSRRTILEAGEWDKDLTKGLSKFTKNLASLGPRIATAVVASVVSSLPKIVGITSRLFGVVQESRIELPNDINKIDIHADASFVIVKPSTKAELVVRKRKNLGDATVDTHDGVLEIKADSVEVELRISVDKLEELRATCDASTLNVEDITIQSIVAKADASSVNLRKVTILKNLSAKLDASVLNIAARIEPMERSSIDISADAAVAHLNLSLPKDAKISINTLVYEASVIDARVDDRKVGLDYHEPGYDEASKKLTVKLDLESTAMKLRIKHE